MSCIIIVSFFKTDFFIFQRIERSIFPSILVLIILFNSCSQQKFTFRNKIAVPKKTAEIVKIAKGNKAKTSQVAADTKLAISPSEVKVNKWKLFKKYNHTAPKSDSMLTVSVGKTVIPSFHYKQLSPEETPPKPIQKVERDSRFGMYSAYCGFFTLFVVSIMIDFSGLLLMWLFVLATALAIAAIVLGSLAFKKRKERGAAVFGLIVGSAWMTFVAFSLMIIGLLVLLYV